VLIAIVDIKEMPPLPFTVVYGTHGTWVLAYWPTHKKTKRFDCHLFLDLTRKW